MILPERINPIIKMTEECNYACSFCRYANHRQKDTGIPVNTVKKYIEEAIKYNIANGVNNMNVIFHGGEPLLTSINKMEAIMEYEKQLSAPSFTIENSIQTNASLINDAWIDFFYQYGFDVGISLDGPIGLNGHYSSSPEKSIEIALKAYRNLKQKGVPCGFLSVVTNNHLLNIERFFEFFTNEGIESVGLCYCYNKMDGDNVDPILLGNGLKALYDLYFNSTKRIHIREFDLITRRLLHRPKNACSMSCRESCGNYITVTPDGNLEFCDDYDLDKGRANSLGNINEQTLIDVLSGEKYQSLKRKSLDIISRRCSDCSVFEMCRGGCSRNDVDDINYFCETYKIIYPHIKNRVSEYMAKRGIST